MGTKKAQEYEALALRAEKQRNFGLAGDLFMQAAEECRGDLGQRSWYERRAQAAADQATQAAGEIR